MSTLEISKEASVNLAEAVAKNRSWLEGVKGKFTSEIALGDGMYSGDATHYLAVGRSAFECITLALKQTGLDRRGVKDVLDFACGFGRVTRWLAAAFPSARLVGMDINPRAAAANRGLFGITVHDVDREWNKVPNDRFDLIWVGSLFTHLSRKQSDCLLKLLHARLKPGGILATTTHGNFVVRRLSSRERSYNVRATEIDGMCADFEVDGYGFSAYEEGGSYGISLVQPSLFMEMARRNKLMTAVYLEKGWADHQDFFGFCR